MIGVEDLPPPPPGLRGWPWTEGSKGSSEDVRSSSISIVTPSYNQAAFLEETIRSVLLQGYPNLEYVVMDGGSTDGSVEIIRKYSPFLSFWESRPDKGQTQAINKGMARATGDILAYLNSDDYYDEGTLGHVAECFARHPEVDLLYGGFRYVDETGGAISDCLPPPFDLTQLLLGNYISQPAVFWRRRVWDSVGPFDETLHYVMDYEYWLRCAQQKRCFVPTYRILANMRLHEGSKTMASECGFGREIIPMLANCVEEGKLAITPLFGNRVLARSRWLHAIALEEIGSKTEARCLVKHAERAHDILENDEDVTVVFGRLMREAHGALLPPLRFARRLSALGLARQRVAEEVMDGYFVRLTNSSGVTAIRAMAGLLCAAVLHPALARRWGFRDALRRLWRKTSCAF